MDERIRVLPPEVTVTVKDGGVLMKTVDKTERTEIARTLRDLEIEVYKRERKIRFRRDIVGIFATSALAASIGIPFFIAMETANGEINVDTTQVGLIDGTAFVTGIAGGAEGMRRVKRYGIDIARLEEQEAALYLRDRALAHKKEDKQKLAIEAVTPSSSK